MAIVTCRTGSWQDGERGGDAGFGGREARAVWPLGPDLERAAAYTSLSNGVVLNARTTCLG